MHEDFLTKLGRHVGSMEEIDSGEDGSFLGRFARIRVHIDVSKPLTKCISIKPFGEKEDIIVLLIYERLPDFCYACGRIGHLARFCEDITVDKNNHVFWSWLRASNHIGSGKGKKSGETSSDSHDNKIPWDSNGSQVNPSNDELLVGNKALMTIDSKEKDIYAGVPSNHIFCAASGENSDFNT